ncbi:MAG: cation-translocating P-type ATPase [Opitutales bacterium]|nr:cation-translocating P-type ATPase [Opitutales bacterium]MCH8541712.1 cation-translocating P-type ATPase [Opitutales bacterium]
MSSQESEKNEKKSGKGEPFWVQVLAEFLHREQGVEAIRFNEKEKALSLATMGEVDEKKLEADLQAVIAAAEKRQKSRPPEFQQDPSPPGGISLESRGEGAELSKPTCPTAPKLWQWREFSWPEKEETGWWGEEWKFLGTLSGICAVAGLSGWLLTWVEAVPFAVSFVLYMIALVAGAWDATIDTVEKAKEKKVDIHFLMLAVAIGASLIGAYGEAVLLLFLFSAAGAMEAYAEARTQKEIRSLFHLQPRQALLAGEEGEQWIEVARLQVGDRIRVRPGDLFPVDGQIVEGETEADESTLTGEAIPVRKEKEAEVFGGTVNLTGSVVAVVTKPATESALEKIIRLIKNAQAFRAPSQRFTDKFGAGYTVGVIGLVAVMFFVWWLVLGYEPFIAAEAGERSAFYLAMTLLVVASPCALVISIPSAILAAIAFGAKRGILFRGGAAIENFAEVDTICFDKTGTLTTGDFEIIGVEAFPANDEKALLQAAYSLEKHSRHPLARAIVDYVEAQGIVGLPVEGFSAWHGVGIKGRVEGQDCLVGRRHIFEESGWGEAMQGVDAPPAGISEVWVLWGKRVGRLLLRDQLRPETKPMLEAFQRDGVDPVMLTGDHPETAEAYAKEIGLAKVFGGLLPEDKVEKVKALTHEGRKVAMVGDGVNDAPSLAAAFISVGMGARGSDAALEQCDFVLMQDRLENLGVAWRLSRKARRIIRQNLTIALGTVVIVGIMAMGALVPLPVGVLAHEGSTVIVCLNSLRLLHGGGKG